MSEHSIGKTIASLRKSKGWTQVELAQKLMVSDKAVSKWESGAGCPEIAQLPVMAKLFDVTIDFLMTGKVPEKEIVTISKAELCAKTDNIKLAEEVKDLPKDENDKNIVDYILQYQSLNVFKKLCEIDPQFINRFDLLDAITFSVLTNSLQLLRGNSFRISSQFCFDFENESEIKSLYSIEDKEQFKDYKQKALCIIPRDFFTMLVTDRRISEDTLNNLLYHKDDSQDSWSQVFPYMIDEAYKHGNGVLLHRLISIAKNNNTVGFELAKNIIGHNGLSLNYFLVSYSNGKRCHGFVRILESTIKDVLQKGDFELFDELDDINRGLDEFLRSKFANDYRFYNYVSKCYVASNDEIRMAKLKMDKSISKSELQIQATIHNQIICIDELLEIKDFKSVKNALEKYPIHRIELLHNFLKENKSRELFQWAVDNEDTKLARLVINNRRDEISEYLFSRHKNVKGINDHHLFLVENGRKMFLIENNRYGYRCDIRNIDAFLEKLHLCKQRIVNELSLKIDKEKLVGELTKEYFENELAKGNTDIVIIKLCVRLEAILRCDYHYEGDFSVMLKEYCEEQLTWQEDDGWGYMEFKRDDSTIKLLNNLRMKRNSIVHSEKTDIMMSEEELKYCIEYITKLG